MKIWVLLPAFNEENSFPRLFPKIDTAVKELGHEYAIVVIDDGSTDDSAAILEELASVYPLHVVTHKINRGLGEAERSAFEYVAEHGAPEDVALRLDCDDTHEPRFFVGMIEQLSKGYDVVTASRFRKGGGQEGVHGYRKYISYAASIYMKIFFNVPNIRDYSCGYRAYRVQVLQDAICIFGNGFIQMKGFGFTSTLETLIKMNLLGARCCEVPFVLRYDQKASPSKMVSSITSLGYIVMTILYWWPFGGWRSFYKSLSKAYRKSPQAAVEKFSPHTLKRSTVCRIGGS